MKNANTCLLPCACRRRPERYPWTGLSCLCSALWGCAWGSAVPAGFFVETCEVGSCAATFWEGSASEGSAGAAGFSVETCAGGLLRGLLCGDLRGGVRLCGLSAGGLPLWGGLRLCGGLVRCGPPPCWGPAQLSC